VEKTGCLASWFLTLPNQHTHWDRYILTLLHLREIEGTPPPVKDFPEAEYELSVMALNPSLNPVPHNFETQGFLSPINFAAQLSLPTDDDARRLAQFLVEKMVVGDLRAEPLFNCGPGSEHDQEWRRAIETWRTK
jgi:hypothetical protein